MHKCLYSMILNNFCLQHHDIKASHSLICNLCAYIRFPIVLVGTKSDSVRAHRNRKSINETRQVTIVAFSIVLTFVCTNLLVVFNNIAEAANFRMTHADAFRTLVYVGNGLVIINSATNLLVYCAAGRRFRQMFAEKIFGLKMSAPSTPASSRVLLKRSSPMQAEECQYNSLDDTREFAEMIDIRKAKNVDKSLI